MVCINNGYVITVQEDINRARGISIHLIHWVGIFKFLSGKQYKTNDQTYIIRIKYYRLLFIVVRNLYVILGVL